MKYKLINIIRESYFKWLFLRKLKKEKSPVIFFIPFHKFGGAETVHRQIRNLIGKNCFTIYTRSSGGFTRDLTFENSRVLFCPGLIPQSNLGKKLIKTINNSIYPVVFGSNSSSYYEFLPFFKPNIYRIDLIHAVSYPDNGIEDLAIRNSHFINTRVCITDGLRKIIMKMMKEANIPDEVMPKMEVVHNTILYSPQLQLLPTELLKRKSIGFVGRSSREKRPEVFEAVAKVCQDILPDWSFHMFGTYNKQGKNGNITYYPPVSNPQKAAKWMEQNISLLIVCSYREGFPMVILEAASVGIPTLSTAVGSIPDFIEHGINGWLVPLELEKNQTTKSFSEMIVHIVSNKNDFESVSINCKNLIANFFSQIDFEKNWTTILKHPENNFIA